MELRIQVTGNGNYLCQTEWKNINRGIYRDFPTTYTDQQDNTKRVGFEVLSIKRDGINETTSFRTISTQ